MEKKALSYPYDPLNMGLVQDENKNTNKKPDSMENTVSILSSSFFVKLIFISCYFTQFRGPKSSFHKRRPPIKGAVFILYKIFGLISVNSLCVNFILTCLDLLSLYIGRSLLITGEFILIIAGALSHGTKGGGVTEEALHGDLWSDVLPLLLRDRVKVPY